MKLEEIGELILTKSDFMIKLIEEMPAHAECVSPKTAKDLQSDK